MKFNNGHWLLQEGVAAYGCVEVEDVAISGNRVTIYAAPFYVTNKGQTLAGPLMTVEFTSPILGIIAVKAYHFKGSAKRIPRFELNADNVGLQVTEDEASITITSGGLTATVNKRPFGISYSYNGRFLTRSDTKMLAYMSTPKGPYIRECLHLSVNEHIYGLGERFTPFVKNGQVVDIWNQDGGTASEQAYKNIPFYVSDRGYGVFVNYPGRVSFEIGSEVVSRVQFCINEEMMEYCVVGGTDIADVVKHYNALTGKPALPPAWSFGLWLSTSFTTDYDEKTVSEFIDGMLDRDIRLSVFHFDCFWMKAYEWCSFTWDEAVFPDVRGMLSRIKDRGIKISCWINPYIGQKSPLFDEAAEKGYMLKRNNGDVWQWDLWQPGMGIVDFTNPEAVKWYQGHLLRLKEDGVDCFKTDFGERIPTDVLYFDGSDSHGMHNYYTYLYNKIVFEVVDVVFARSATTGCQQFPVHWGGDCEATYEAMAESLRGGLSLSLSGFGFWSHDIGGFESTSTPDLYKRWIAFGLLSSHSRLHGSSSYRVPWLYDDEASDVLRFFTELKYSLMPYIFAKAVEASTTGLPIMRAMVMCFPSDPACAYLDTQYMLGDNILVAPVFSPDGKVSAYLPAGRWTHLLTGEVIDGGKYIERTYDYFGVHLWAKQNSLIAFGSGKNGADYDYSKELVIHAYDVTNASCVIYDNKAQRQFELEMKKDGERIVVEVKGVHEGFDVLYHAEHGDTQFSVALGETRKDVVLNPMQ